MPCRLTLLPLAEVSSPQIEDGMRSGTSLVKAALKASNLKPARSQDSKIPSFERWSLGNLVRNLGKNIFTPAPASCYIGCKPRGPVCDDTFSVAFATPTDKRGFVMPKFWGVVRQRAPFLKVTGEMGLSARTPARLLTCHQHLAHLLRVMTHLVVPCAPVGKQTMTASTLTSRRAAHTSPASGTPDLIQLHADAHNALNMAVFYLRQPQADTAAARRKAIQALTALRGLSLALEG